MIFYIYSSASDYEGGHDSKFGITP